MGNIGRIGQRRAERRPRGNRSHQSPFPRPVRRLTGRRSSSNGPRASAANRGRPDPSHRIGGQETSSDSRETTRPAGELLRLVIRPQEVVAALIALDAAYEQYSSAVNEFNAAQFTLYRALGQPAQWVTANAAHVPLNPPAPGANAAMESQPPAENPNRARVP